MNIICKQNSILERSYISIECHKSKLILNLDGKNILYDFDDYKKLLKYIANFIDEHDVYSVKNYIQWNNEYIAKLILLEEKVNNNDNQLSLF